MVFIQEDFQDTRDTQLIKRAKIDAASSGDNTLVAAVTGKKIRVLAAFFTMTAWLSLSDLKMEPEVRH